MGAGMLDERSRSVVRDLLDAPDPANVRSLRAAADYHRRHNIAWSEASESHVAWVPDLTCGRWPMVCDARSPMVAQAGHPAVQRAYVCTRRAHHSGRHAAGAAGRIVAVWWRLGGTSEDAS